MIPFRLMSGRFHFLLSLSIVWRMPFLSFPPNLPLFFFIFVVQKGYSSWSSSIFPASPTSFLLVRSPFFSYYFYGVTLVPFRLFLIFGSGSSIASFVVFRRLSLY